MILGFRMWRMNEATPLRPIVSFHNPWKTATARAVCSQGTRSSNPSNSSNSFIGSSIISKDLHRSPNFSCSCGIHAYDLNMAHTWDDWGAGPSKTNENAEGAYGLVALWGRIIEHRMDHTSFLMYDNSYNGITGYRAEYARVLGIYPNMFSNPLFSSQAWLTKFYPRSNITLYETWDDLQQAAKTWES